MRLPSVLARKRRGTLPQLTRFDEWRRQGIKIGKGCHIYDAFLDPLSPQLISIGDYVTLSGGVAILAHDAAMMYARGEARFAPVRILDRSFIGHRAIILAGVTVGPGSIVGAGAVVTRDVAPGTVVAGNPAKLVCMVEEYRQRLARYPASDFVTVEDVGREDPAYPEARARYAARIRERFPVESGNA